MNDAQVSIETQSSGPRPSSSRPPAGVVIRGQIYDSSGYSSEARGVVFGLNRARIPIRFEPVVLQDDVRGLLTSGEREELEALKHQRIDLARSVYFQHYPAHDFNLALRGRHRVGRTMYESDSLPDGWLPYCLAMDEVWVPSTFNCQTFAAAGMPPDRLRALPGGVNTTVFRPGSEPLPIPERRGFNFLSIFEWIQRKGPDVLLRAYLSEFKSNEDVTLILKTYGYPDPNMELLPRLAYFVERNMGMRLEDAPTVILLTPDVLSGTEIPRLYASADAFVLPTRGEGWGRPYMEALACECPVIATRWGGQMDFLHEGISDLLDYELVPVPGDTDSQLSAGHRWAEPSVEHLRQLMRSVFEHREESKQKAVLGRAEMVDKWDWDKVIGERWVPEFERLLA
jgi:glycosyltransferase involved in cell wall biosynthesis